MTVQADNFNSRYDDSESEYIELTTNKNQESDQSSNSDYIKLINQNALKTSNNSDE